MPSPGAATCVAPAPQLEKQARVSSLLEAATEMTLGSGNQAG